MPPGDTKSRGTKRRTELVATMDTLSSHLQTTFVALSNAFCQRKSDTKGETFNLVTSRPPVQAHMAIMLGPSVGSAKAKVMLVLDGLEVKLWGVREDSKSRVDCDSVSDENDSEKSEEEFDSEEDFEEAEGVPDSESESDEEYEDCVDHCSISVYSSPPRQRPSPPTTLDSPRPSQSASGHNPVPSSVLSISTRAPSRTPSRETTPLVSHEEIQKSLIAADRLLSRTLASACAEDGGGLSCELGASFPVCELACILTSGRTSSHPDSHSTSCTKKVHPSFLGTPSKPHPLPRINSALIPRRIFNPPF